MVKTVITLNTNFVSGAKASIGKYWDNYRLRSIIIFYF